LAVFMRRWSPAGAVIRQQNGMAHDVWPCGHATLQPDDILDEIVASMVLRPTIQERELLAGALHRVTTN
jgi:hypothetical protein